MFEFGPALRRLQEQRGVSLGQLAELTHYDKGYLSKIVNGRRPVSDEVALACDAALDAHGELIAAARLDAVAIRDSRPSETSDLVERLQASDATPQTLERLAVTVFELCCDYPYCDAVQLRREAQGWLRRVESLLRRPVGLRQHGELLVSAGWLALLIGCLEYDLGMRVAAERTRVAARQLGTEANQPDVVGWASEMAAWFALTQGRYAAVLTAARQGRYVAGRRAVSAQLFAQEAKVHDEMMRPSGCSTPWTPTGWPAM